MTRALTHAGDFEALPIAILEHICRIILREQGKHALIDFTMMFSNVTTPTGEFLYKLPYTWGL